MDETSVGRHVRSLRGTIAAASCSRAKATDHASLADRRSYISYLACVAQDVTVQPKLPQVLLGNEHQFTLELLREVAGKLPASISLWRQKSSWNSHGTMRKWLTLLSKALGRLVQQRYVVLLLDVHASHIDNTIFQHARRCGIRIVYLPAKMTRFLQPCDTHVFAKFKLAVRKAWQETKARSLCGRVSTAGWLQVVCGAVEAVVSRGDWRQAFQADGVLDAQQQLSQQLRAELGFDGALMLPRVAPTAEAVRAIFPSRMKVDVLSYVLWQPKCQRPKPKQAAAAASSSKEPPAPLPKRRVLPATFQPAKEVKVIRTLN